MDAHPSPLELCASALPERITSESRVQGRVAGQRGQLHRSNAATARRLLPGFGHVIDLALLGHPLDAEELGPLHVSDDRYLHGSSLTFPRSPALEDSDIDMRRLPPFEHLYQEHRDEILAFLTRRLGRAQAEDAFQDTFLRALRTYDGLCDPTHLRAWLYTIAGSVATDHYRRSARHAAELPARTDADGDTQPAWLELAPLTDELPRAQRAAVVLRFGYDLTYAEIGSALGSNEDAARQAASAGVRRLRRQLTSEGV